MLPRHIGFIMDGNGRWAQARALPRSEGYAFGLAALGRVLRRCGDKGIAAVSVYAFSTENNARPKEEIEAIDKVVSGFNNSYKGDYKIVYMTSVNGLSEEMKQSIEDITRRTRSNKGLTLNIAYNYGGRTDIINAARACRDCIHIGEKEFEARLASAKLPPLDLIVRTGGEKRLSGFMLYEAAYSELVFTDKLWPDMTEDDVDCFLEEFGRRKRKFGA